jgi:hypothetical protein
LGLLAEVVRKRGNSKQKFFLLNVEERLWLSLLETGIIKSPHLTIRNPRSTERWKLRVHKEQIAERVKIQNCHILFFDGASKGNPGEAGAGGVLLYPGGNNVGSFASSLGVATNNQVESYALWQGVSLLLNRNIQQAIIIGDSSLIIRHMVMDSTPSNT